MIQDLIAKLTGGLVDLVVNVCLTVLAPMAVAWVGMQINKTRIGKKSMLDDEIFNALEVGVSNVGNTMAKAWKEAHADGVITAEEKTRLQALAIKGAKENLSPEADRIFKKYTPEKIQNLIRFLVDQSK